MDEKGDIANEIESSAKKLKAFMDAYMDAAIFGEGYIVDGDKHIPFDKMFPLVEESEVGQKLIEAGKTISTQQAKIDDMWKTLCWYGIHLRSCDLISEYASGKPCSCGYNDAMKLSRKE